ncbi:MAG TPA: MerR family transcriptional regulator [Chloroflexota bacterium]|nr:MerR family transcriptional regulator [Chloroflexota bacterium]
MREDGERLTIDGLARQAGVPVRTVRYYISEGLLPGPAARGRGATYDREHLARLRLIRLLAEQHVPLAEQRQRLADLSPNEVEALLREERRRGMALERASQAPSPRAYISHLIQRAEPAPPDAPSASRAYRGQNTEPQNWRRWEIVPGVELHARNDAARVHAQLIERLLQTSRDWPGRRSEYDAAFERGEPPHA